MGASEGWGSLQKRQKTSGRSCYELRWISRGMPWSETNGWYFIHVPYHILVGKKQKCLKVSYKQKVSYKLLSSWWFQISFFVHPLSGEMIQFDEHIFHRGLKPPTRFRWGKTKMSNISCLLWRKTKGFLFIEHFLWLLCPFMYRPTLSSHGKAPVKHQFCLVLGTFAAASGF